MVTRKESLSDHLERSLRVKIQSFLAWNFKYFIPSNLSEIKLEFQPERSSYPFLHKYLIGDKFNLIYVLAEMIQIAKLYIKNPDITLWKT